MILKIGNRKFDKFTALAVALEYDSTASAFSFSIEFDPGNEDHKAAFKPGLYPAVTIEEDGQTLITGILLSYGFSSDSNTSLLTVAGYSKTGVLQDCEIPREAYPLQSKGLSIKQICEKIAKPFGLNVIVDSAVSARATQAYSSSTASDNGTAKDYIAKLAGQKQIMFTHDEFGNLLLTETKANQLPIYDFVGTTSGITMGFSFDGQKMHSAITLQKQATKTGKGNAGISTYKNPYVAGFRPTISRQTSGKDVDTAYGARNVLSDELKGMPLVINIEGWTLNGKIIRPNSIVTVTNPELFLYKKTKFFIQKVTYKGDEKSQTATLECVIPECFNNDTPINIFS